MAKTAIKSIKKGKLDLSEAYDVIESVGTLLDGQLTLADAEALFNLVSPVSTKELKGIGKSLGINKSVKDQALDIKKSIGNKKTVKVKVDTKGMKNGKEVNVKEMNFDLDGPLHKGVETPHVQRSIENVNPKTGEVNLNKDNSAEGVRPMTQQDIGTVRKVLKKRNN